MMKSETHGPGRKIILWALAVTTWAGAAAAEVYPNGLLVASLDVAVSPRAAGVVEAIFVKEGQWVTLGDTLAVLDDAKEQLDLELSTRELEELHISFDKMRKGMLPKEIEKMEVDLKKSILSEEKAMSELERMKRLHEQKAVSDKELADSKNAADLASLSVKSLILALELAKENPRPEDVLLQEMKITQKMTAQEQKKLTLDKMAVRAPCDGFISKLYYAPGEYAASGSPFSDIVNTDTIYVELNLPVSEIKDVKEGTKATVTVPSITSATYPGRVVMVGPTVDPASRTFKIRIEISNPKRLLKPGLFATVSL